MLSTPPLELVKRSEAATEKMRNWQKASRNKRHRRIFTALMSGLILLFILGLIAARRISQARALNLLASSQQLQDAANRALAAFTISYGSVWVLPFDDRWRVLLGSSACPVMPAISASLSQESDPREVAVVLAERLLKGSSRRIIEVGKSFLLGPSDSNSPTYVYAVLLETGSLGEGDSVRYGAHFVKPVTLAKQSESEVSSSSCDIAKYHWIKRAVMYSLLLFHKAKRVPLMNPMEEAGFGDALCCERNVLNSQDLSLCGKPCTAAGVFNILKVFPSN